VKLILVYDVFFSTTQNPAHQRFPEMKCNMRNLCVKPKPASQLGNSKAYYGSKYFAGLFDSDEHDVDEIT